MHIELGVKLSIKGIAELPLHEGSVPRWLFNRMVKLANAIITVFVNEFGEDKFLERLANPLWFQAFSNVLGFDWHSSGSTTVVCGVLRQALNKSEVEIAIAGGKGKKSLETPIEVKQAAIKLDLGEEYGEKLARISRLVAKIDNAALQDGYSIYHHSMIVSKSGSWTVIQQGMNVEKRMARRYHWLSSKVRKFVEDPHNAIVDVKISESTLNLVARESRSCRNTILEIINHGPAKLKRDLGSIKRFLRKNYPITRWFSGKNELAVKLDYYKPIEEIAINWRALRNVFQVKPEDFESFLLFRGIGPSTLRALALISELIYDEPPSKKDPITHIFDPIKWSFAVGGKDGIPYPINRKVYDSVVYELEQIISDMRVGSKEKLFAFKRLKSISERWSVNLRS